MLRQYLQNIGLGEKEAAVYLSLLEEESASVVKLAQKTKINRTTIYLILEALMKKGLASKTQKDKKAQYLAEPPERLKTYLEREKVKLNERSQQLKDVIPQLKSLQREKEDRPIVKYFEGKEGIISSMTELFNLAEKSSDNTMRMIYPRDLVEEKIPPEEIDRLQQHRTNKKVKVKSIYTSEKKEIPSNRNADRHKIDHTKYPIKCDISVYGDITKINTLGDKLSGISIINPDVADTIKSLLDLTIDLLKEKDQSNNSR